MFNVVGKNLTFTVFKTTVHRLFPRSLCSSPAASDNSFTVSCLIDSWGFPPEKAMSASKYLNLKTPDRADSVIAFFKNQGFTKSQITGLVRKFLTLTYNLEKILLPKFEFLRSKGLSDSDIAMLLTTSPSSIGRSLKNHIEPTFNLLTDLLRSNDRTLVAIMVLDFQANMIANMQILRDVGVPGSKMPKDFLATTDQFKKDVEEVVEMDFDPLKSSFVLAVHAIRSMSKSTWEKKMETYKKWGCSEAQILLAFRVNPGCMLNSEKKIDKVMDYLVNKMGFQTSIVAKNFNLISHSMEKRIIPRSLVYQYCLDNGLMKDKKYCGFIWWLTLPENLFMNRLEGYKTKAPDVLKIYQEKLDQKN